MTSKENPHSLTEMQGGLNSRLQMYHDGRLDVQPAARHFLPARIIESSHFEQQRTGTKPPGVDSGAIDIEIGEVRVRITGSADPGCIRAALEQLRR